MTGDRPILLPGTPPEDGPVEQPDVTTPADDKPPTDLDGSLPMAAPKMWTRGFMIICGVVTAIFLLIIREASAIFEISVPIAAWFIPVVALMILIVIRKILLPPSARVIYFDDDIVRLPRGRNSRRTHKIAYDELRTIVPLVSRGQPALVIDGPNRTHIYVASDFPHPELWRVLWAQLMDRIARRPGASTQLPQMRELARLSQKSSSVAPGFTKRLFWVIAVVFAAQLFLAPPVDILQYLYFGANSSVMVLQEGQVWRVVTANLLHGGGIHFAVNAFALYFLGTYCERLFGERRTIVLILGTAVAGAAASLLGTAALFAVGISTALFGLLGSYFALHLRFGKQLPPPYRQSRRWWTVILGLNLVLSVAVPLIDGWGHFGGFIAGVALGWAMLMGQEKFEPRPPSGRFMSFAAIGLVALFTACSVIAIVYAFGEHPEDEIAVAQALLDRAEEDEPALLAQVSYEWARHSPRPEGLNPILVAIAEIAHRRSDDLFIEWRSTSTILLLADEMAEPFERRVKESGIVRFEETAWRHDATDARHALARVLTGFVNQAGTLHAADSPFTSARIVDNDVVLEPGGRLDEHRRVYVLAVEDNAGEDISRLMLHRCVAAGDNTGTARPVDRDLEAARTLRLAMVTAADVCTADEAETWRTTPVISGPNPK